MVKRNEITITNITRLPSGRGIAAEYRGIWLVNVYAPSGTAKRQEREHFYNNELPILAEDLPIEYDRRRRLELCTQSGIPADWCLQPHFQFWPPQ